MRLLVPVLITGTAFALSAGASVSFFVTVPILVVMLTLAATWPWPDVMHTPTGQPWSPWGRAPRPSEDDELDLFEQELWPHGWKHLLNEPQDNTITDEGNTR